MKILFSLLFTLILAAQALFGADEPAPVAIKHKSSFNLDAGTRNPFSPIGWKPTGRVASGSVGSSQGEVPPGAFVVSTLTVDGATPSALIHGNSVPDGPHFGLEIGTQIYHVQVKR